MVGQEWVDNQSDGFSVVTRGQSNDNLLTMSTAARAESYTDTMNEARYLSFFGRAEYNYLSRYYADISLRRDASSRFGVDSRWANFWSVGGMWNAKGEKFLKNVDWLTNAQLAASIGTSGNSSIPAYEHLAPLFKLITLVKPIKYRFYSLLPELLFYQFFEFSMTYFVFRE